MHRRATLGVVSEPSGCIFDSVLNGSQPAWVVADEGDVVAFLDIRPVFPGHTLVVPRTHWATIEEVPEAMLGRLFEVGRRVAAAQRSALDAHGTFFGLNDVVSQSVPHVHLHVIPRRRKDGLRGFFWPRQRYAGDGEAAGIAAAIGAAMAPPPAGGATAS